MTLRQRIEDELRKKNMLGTRKQFYNKTWKCRAVVERANQRDFDRRRGKERRQV